MNDDLVIVFSCLILLVAVIFFIIRKLLLNGNILDFISRNDSNKSNVVRENSDETLEYSVDSVNSRLRIRVKKKIGDKNFSFNLDTKHFQLSLEETLFLYEVINKVEI